MDFEAQAREDVEQVRREGLESLERGVARGRVIVFVTLAVLAGGIVGLRKENPSPWAAIVFTVDTLYALAILLWVRRTKDRPRWSVTVIAHLDPLVITASAILLRMWVHDDHLVHGLPLPAWFDTYCLAPVFMLLLYLGCTRVTGAVSRAMLGVVTMALYGVAIVRDVGEFMPPQVLAMLFVGAGGLFGALASNRIVDLLNRQARLTLLRRYVPQTLVDRVSDDSIDPKKLMVPQSLEVTMLVADLRGFTAISEKLTPEAVVEMLGEYHTAMLGAVDASGGIVDKFLGDGILVVFGLPARPDAAPPLDQGAAAAVQCAAAMLFRLGALNEKRRTEGREPLAMGIGIHTGPVVAGTIGAGGRREFTVIGDAVNTASRLEGLTKSAQSPVLVSGATVSRLGGIGGGVASSLRELEPMPIRGKAEPLRVYALDRGSGLLRVPRTA